MANLKMERARAGAILEVERRRNEVGQLEEKIRDLQGKMALLGKRLRRLEGARDTALLRLTGANDRVVEFNEKLSPTVVEEEESGSAD